MGASPVRLARRADDRGRSTRRRPCALAESLPGRNRRLPVLAFDGHAHLRALHGRAEPQWSRWLVRVPGKSVGRHSGGHEVYRAGARGRRFLPQCRRAADRCNGTGQSGRLLRSRCVAHVELERGRRNQQDRRGFGAIELARLHGEQRCHHLQSAPRRLRARARGVHHAADHGSRPRTRSVVRGAPLDMQRRLGEQHAAASLARSTRPSAPPAPLRTIAYCGCGPCGSGYAKDPSDNNLCCQLSSCPTGQAVNPSNDNECCPYEPCSSDRTVNNGNNQCCLCRLSSGATVVNDHCCIDNNCALASEHVSTGDVHQCCQWGTCTAPLTTDMATHRCTGQDCSECASGETCTAFRRPSNAVPAPVPCANRARRAIRPRHHPSAA